MERNPGKQLFEQIKTESLGYIDDSIEDRTVENYYLDFKRTQEADYSGRRSLFDSDKRNYAKAISAFGNSEGGVLVWGINTGEADADYASSKATIQSVSNFKSLLEGFTSQVTTPPHPSVEHLVIFEDEENDTGYVVSHIPKSSKRPFQVVANNDFRYYIRAGSSSLPAPDNYLRALFGQEPQPDVFIFWGASPVTFNGEGMISCQVGFMLHNRGENVARNLNGYVHVGGRDMGVQVNPNTVNQFDYYSNSLTGMKVGFTAKPTFTLGVEQEVQPLIVHVNIGLPITDNGIQIRALVNADNQMSARIDLEVTSDELEALYNQYIEDEDFDIMAGIFKSQDDE